MGCFYQFGVHGVGRDLSKAVDLWRRAGELGSLHHHGDYGVPMDLTKANDYYERAALSGHVVARFCLGQLENEHRENPARACKHWMIAAGAGFDKAMDKIRYIFLEHRYLITKEEYEGTLREGGKGLQTK